MILQIILIHDKKVTLAQISLFIYYPKLKHGWVNFQEQFLKVHNLRGSITIKTLPDECGHVIEIAVNYLQSLNEYFFKSLRFLFYFTGSI